MAAVVEVRSFHGTTPGLGQDVTGETIRFKQADDDVADANDSIPVPSVGYGYSYRKSLKLVATGAPDNLLSNLRFYSDGVALGTGRSVLIATSTTYTQGASADAEAAISAVDVDDYSLVSPLVLQAGDWIQDDDTLPTDGGALQAYVQLQLRIATDAIAGNSSAKTIAWLYDET